MTHICSPGSCTIHCRTEAERALDAAADTSPLTQRELAGLYAISDRSIRDARAIVDHPDIASAVRAGRVSLRQGARQARAASRASVPGLPAGELRTGDFRNVLADLPDNSVNAIITDVPWPPCAGYEPGLYQDLGQHAARLLAQGGAIAALVDQAYAFELETALRAHLRYVWTIAYVIPKGQRNSLNLFSWWYPVIVCSNGRFRGFGWGSDQIVAGFDLVEAIPRNADYACHDYAKSPDGMGELVRRISEPGNLVLDPFAGSNPVGRACATLGRRFLGCDLHTTMRASAVGRG
ncbi:MAG: hypothetical protein M3R63_12975 [Actinomycetota bacterium]|nr:hypothetical protein [Actinomycetota bacterium]